MKRIFILAFVLCFGFLLQAQQEVRIGDYRFVPDQNIKEQSRVVLKVAAKKGVLSTSSNRNKVKANRYLLQFEKLPDFKQRAKLKELGIQLQEYLGSNAYYARMEKEVSITSLKQINLSSVMPIDHKWKIDRKLTEGNVPDYAKLADGKIKTNLYYTAEVDESFVKQYFAERKFDNVKIFAPFKMVTINLDKEEIAKLAQESWVNMLTTVQAPQFADNIPGYTMTRSNILGTSAALNGRGLTGKSVRVGIWDGDIESHVDYGSRIHQQEFEMSVSSSHGHGMHVAGTVAGAGILDPKARGIAPEADLYTYNFNTQSNGLNAQQEMYRARNQFGITQTQNSYGVDLSKVCKYYNQITYNAFGGDYNLDLLTNLFPTLTHVFAAGNEQGACGHTYGSSSKRVKNAILVGAVNKTTDMSSFSSFGPMDDGRLIPTVSSFGVNVYSTLPDNKYGDMSGTSMACPNVSGVVALLTQRYMQLNNKKEPRSDLIRAVIANTAQDRGRKGPDYQYGYGIVNAEAAAVSIENNWYRFGAMAAGGNNNDFVINVPADAKQLRVMLVWNDLAANIPYTYGKPALINDIDLRVISNGNVVKPWCLDKDNPKAVAVRGNDKINNIEQVTIDNPKAGTYTIRVEGGNKVVYGIQNYAIVYYFEKDNFRLTYPNGGESFAPGEQFVMNWEYNKYPVNVEISYDNGKTFQTIASGLTADQNVVTIPDNAPTTGQAIFRITDGEKFDVSDASFRIIGVPQDLKYDISECGINNWNLVWNSVKGITKYEVLKANVAEGNFDIIAEVSDTTFTIPENKIAKGKRNVYTVRAKTDAGLVGQRAKGVFIKASQPLVITANKLPFVEKFAQYPSKFIKVDAGTNMRVLYLSNAKARDAKPGEHFFATLPSTAATNWNSTNPFANLTNKTKLKICELDLSTLASGSKVNYEMDVIQGYSDVPESSVYKILVNDNQVSDLAGVNLFKAVTNDADPERKIVVDLASYVGQKVKIEVVFAGKNKNDLIIITGIKVFVPTNDIDLELNQITTTESGINLTNQNPVSIVFTNNSDKSVSNVPVGFQINDAAPIYETINKEIKAHEQFRYTFVAKADFSTTETLGKKFKLKTILAYEDDVDENNNIGIKEVVNFGNVYPLTESDVQDFFGTPSPIDPKITKEVDGSLIFTDLGGALLPYKNTQKSTVKFVPKDDTKIIQIVFDASKFELEDGYDELQIFNKEVSNLARPGTPTAIYTGKMSNDVKIISQSPDGSITLQFKSDNVTVKSGWVAEVREIDSVNIFTLAPLSLNNNYPNQEFDLSINVTNNTNAQVDEVEVEYRVNGINPVKETISSIAANTSIDYTFTKKVSVPFGSEYKITATILSADANVDDNVRTFTFVNDNYCKNARVVNPYSLYVKSLQIGASKITSSYSNNIEYNTTLSLDMYKNVPNSVDVSLNKVDTESSIGIWIDWNNDGTFGDEASGEFYKSTINDKNVKLDIVAPASATKGKKRMRIIAAKTDELSACPTQSLTVGNIEDYTIELIDNYPVNNDLELVSTTIKSGKNLSANEDVTVLIKNNGAQTVSNFSLTYAINGEIKANETANITLAAFQQAEYTFNTKADFSAAGEYNITLNINRADDVADNNQLTKSIYNSIPETDGYYALNVIEDRNASEYVKTGTLNGASPSTFTYEAWIKPNKMGLNNIFDGKGVLITTFGEGGTLLAKNSIVVRVGKKQYVYTGADVIKPGQWQHIAVTGRITGSWIRTTLVTIYVNGQPVATQKEGNDYVLGKEGSVIYIAPLFDGMVDEARIWNVERSQTDISANMYNTLRNADGNLPNNLLAEFSFNEGPGNLTTYSGSDLAIIKSNRTAAGDNSIWKAPTELISGTNFDQQVATSQKEDNIINVALKTGTNFAKVTGNLIKTWPKTEVLYKGKPVDANTEFDFSSGSIQVEATATGIFGRNLSETVTINVKNDLSSDCELLSFNVNTADNPGLMTSVSAEQPISQSISITLTGDANITAIKPTITVSKGAKVIYNGTELGNNTIDLSNPVILRVVSENGRYSKDYSVKINNEQSISWNLDSPATYTYGDSKVKLTAKASSDLPVSYISDNNNIVSIDANGYMAIVGIGTTNVKAIQNGTGIYGAASPVSKIITVKPKTIIIKPKDITVNYTEAIPPIEYEYIGLVENSDANNMVSPPNYTIYQHGNTAWTAGTTYLPVGNDHKIKADNASKYASGNYMVAPAWGIITVNSVTTNKVSFNVTTTGGAAVEGATININNCNITTDAAGRASIDLSQNSQYSYTVTKTAYSSVSQQLNVVDTDIDVNAIINPETISLTYNAGTNGVIIGETLQNIAQGEDGTQVIVSPNSGYTFGQWSDGVTANPRTDHSVNSNITVTAQYNAINFTIEYTAGSGGTISGSSTQSVTYEASTTEVTATPDAGYYFIGWSDGNINPTRKETNVKDNATYTATFGLYQNLDYTQNFDTNTETPEHWRNIDKEGDGSFWKFQNASINISGTQYSVGSGNYAYINSDADGLSKDQDAYLISPRFKLDPAKPKVVIVEFDYRYRKYQTDFFELTYSIDAGNTWIKLKEFDGKYKEEQHFKEVLDLSSHGAVTNITFAWRYKASYAWFVMMDNIKISYPQSYNVNFTVTDGTNPIAAAQVEIDGKTLTTDATGKVSTELIDGDYNYTVSKVGYQSFSGSTKVEGADTDVNVSLKTKYDITFNVSDGTNPIAGANISINGLTLTTSAAGTVSTQLIDGEYNYTVVAANYENVSSALTVNAVNITENVNLKTAYKLHFNVKSDGSAVQGVSISVGNQTVTTNAVGKATAKLSNGSYSYMAYKIGYNEVKGNTTIANAEATVNISLEKTENNIAFTVTDGKNAISGASIKVNGKTITTNAQGKATATKLVSGTYEYSVTKKGYDTVTNEETIYGSDVETNVTLEKTKHEIVFTVTDDKNAVYAAEIVINGKTIKTDLNGKVTIDLVDGEYEYAVTKNHYDKADGKVTIAGSGKSVNITLNKTKYDVVFTVTDGENAIEGAKITINGETLTTDDKGRATSKLVYDTYNYTVSKEGYHSVSNELLVYQSGINENITLQKIKYNVEFNVTDGEKALFGTQVAINGTTLTVYSSGKASIKLIDGEYDYTVTKKGYDTLTGKVSVAGENVSVNLTLEKTKYDVTFNVTDGTKSLADANVLINGETLTTDASGTVTVKLINGDYDYQVSKNGFTESTGKVYISDENETVDVVLDAKYNIVFTVTNANKAVENVNITIGYTKLTTDANGKASAEFTKGYYYYSLRKDGFDAISGKAVVVDKDLAINVDMLRTGFEVLNNNEIELFPNPFAVELTLKNVESVETVIIRSVSGQIVKKVKNTGLKKMTIDTSDIKSGTYFVMFQNKSGVISVEKAIKL